MISKISKNFLLSRDCKKKEERKKEKQYAKHQLWEDNAWLELRLSHAVLRGSDFGKVVLEIHQHVLNENSYIFR